MAADLSRVAAGGDNSVADVFSNLRYSEVMEPYDVAYAWLEKHGRKFKGFTDNVFLTTYSGKPVPVLAEFSQEKLCDVFPSADSEVEDALKTAQGAQKLWAALPAFERAKHLYSFARNVQKHATLLAQVESLSTGKRLNETRGESVPHAVRCLYHYAGWTMHLQENFPHSQPLGVVAVVAGNTTYLHTMSVFRLTEILAAGNSAVLVVNPQGCLPAFLLAEIAASASLPKGLVTVLVGESKAVRESKMVDKLFFVGPVSRGQELRRAVAGTGKMFSSYHGGRPIVVLLEGCDVSSAVNGVLETFAASCGKSDSSGVQVFVQESVYQQFMKLVRTRFSKLRCGTPNEKTADVVPFLNSGTRAFSSSNISEKLVVTASKELQSNFTSLKDALLLPAVEPSSPVAVDSVGNPVVLVSQFRTAKEAISLINCVPQRVCASIWTERLTAALELAASLKVPTCFVNGQNLYDPAAEFGGRSGTGYIGGEQGMLELLKPDWHKRELLQKTVIDYRMFGNKSDPSRVLPHAFLSGDGSSIDLTLKLYYGGQQKRPESNTSCSLTNSKNEVVEYIPEAGKKDVRNAVEAASAGLRGWRTRDPHNRAQILYYIAENLSQRRTAFAGRCSRATEQPEETWQAIINVCVQRLFYWAAACDKYAGKVQATTTKGMVLKLHEPVGVIGIVCADSSPLLSFVSLTAAAIANGNAVVVLASEKCPLPALLMYQVFETSDLPAGVVNILSGYHEPMVRTLAEHHDVQSLWYHGSSREAAVFVEEASAVNMKRTWIGRGDRDWGNDSHCTGWEFRYHATAVKTIWLPSGDIFAN
ncbi:aldehyde dehydrogenase family 16 member A1-like [Ornithodoros turicata]|uniref:aldehyde dehydrogenase family 16 member A1-like n=1 Tax=Ornithodoros turicata TaxID=34597 RepID=UPI0031386AFC